VITGMFTNSKGEPAKGTAPVKVVSPPCTEALVKVSVLCGPHVCRSKEASSPSPLSQTSMNSYSSQDMEDKLGFLMKVYDNATTQTGMRVRACVHACVRVAAPIWGLITPPI
jgi:hypothetical protein